MAARAACNGGRVFLPAIKTQLAPTAPPPLRTSAKSAVIILSTIHSSLSTGRHAAAMLAVLSGLLGVSQPMAGAEGEFVNLSTRAYVETGDKVTIGGFIIEGEARKVVIHAIGPELANRGVSDALADPVLRVIDTTDPANFRELMVNDNWNDSQGQELSDIWGSALPFTADSKSSAAVLTLEPGNYTAIVEGKDGTSGIALVEVWKINPPDSGRPDRELLTAVYGLYGVMAGYYWSINFGEAGITYQNIGTLEGYDTPILTPCGQLGLNNAFYCSINQGIYYDTGFFEEYEVQDKQVAPAVIIAHEFGHHVSWLLDLWKVNTRKQEELQADCFAGAWTRSAHDYFELTPEELRQAVLLMYELGHPEYTWFDPELHGTMEQRVDAFVRGFDYGWTTCLERDWLVAFADSNPPLAGSVSFDTFGCRDYLVFNLLVGVWATAETEVDLESYEAALGEAIDAEHCGYFDVGDIIQWEGDLKILRTSNPTVAFPAIRVWGTPESGPLLTRQPRSQWWVNKEAISFGQ